MRSLISGIVLTPAADGRIDGSRVRAGLVSAGLAIDTEALEGLVSETVEHAIRVQTDQKARIDLADAGLPTVELPEFTGGVDVAALYELAEVLTGQGVR